MAITLTLGSYDLYSGTLKLAAKNGWQRGRGDSDIETFNLVARGSEAGIITAVDAIDDQLVAAEKYISNLLEATPVWLTYNADGETAKRALVRGGQLSEVSQGAKSPLLRFDAEAAILVVERGPWEDLTTDTELSAVNYDWDDAVQNIDSTPGTLPARIDELKITGTATNDETAPLVKGWIGVREEYQGRTGFDPVWEAEHGTMGTDTSIASVNDSNTSPTGSSADNCVECTFGTATMAKRLSISLEEASQGGTNLVSNGGAETGDLADWTLLGGTITVSDVDKYTGTYSFRGVMDDTVNNGAIIRQFIAFADGYGRWEYAWKIAAASGSGDSFLRVRITFHDSGYSQLSGGTGYIYYTKNGTTAWAATNKLTGNAPANTAYIQVYVHAYCDSGDAFTFYIDDIKAYDIFPASWHGKYNILMRAMLSAGSSEIGAMVKTGYSGTTYKYPSKEIIITNTDWKLLSMGTITIPPGRTTSGDLALLRLANIATEIWAEQISGSANLRIDALFFVPCNCKLSLRNLSICRSASVNEATLDYDYANLRASTKSDGTLEILADSEDFEGINANIEYSATDWYLPTGNTMVVAVFEREASHELADDFEMTMTTYPRHRNRNAQ